MLWRLVRTYTAPYRRLVGVLLLLQLAGAIAALYLPHLNADIIDQGVAKGDTAYILRSGGWMLLFSVVQIVATAAAVYLGARVAMGLGRDLRAAFFRHVGDFSAQEVAKFGAPTLISRNTNDVTQVQTVVFMSLAMIVSAPINMVGGVVMALRTDVGLSWLVAVAVPVLATIMLFVIRQMMPQFRLMQTSLDDVNRILREQITGIRVVRAFVREAFEAERFGEANARLSGTALRVGQLQALIFPTVMVVLNLSSVGVLWFGAKRVGAGAMEIGALSAYMAYLVQILIAVLMASFMSMMIPRAAVSAERIVEVLDTPSSITAPVNPVAELASAPAVVFDDVFFQYPGAEAPVIKGVSFVAEPGKTTAIIGSTGSGKTTLVQLVPRLFDVTGGTLSVGGVDVRALEPDTLWSHIGLVPQRPYLFSGTVASNLRYGNPAATDDDLWEALRVAQVKDFVEKLPGGLESPISQGGTNVSGGQRQRLAIARALVKKTSVYLFDDSFSALDLATDARLRAELKPATRDATVIVVAQRVSTIVDADLIVVLDDGRVVGQGRHAELLTSCATYREIVQSQQAVEEVAS